MPHHLAPLTEQAAQRLLFIFSVCSEKELWLDTPGRKRQNYVQMTLSRSVASFESNCRMIRLCPCVSLADVFVQEIHAAHTGDKDSHLGSAGLILTLTMWHLCHIKLQAPCAFKRGEISADGAIGVYSSMLHELILGILVILAVLIKFFFLFITV